jgi:hypothetical protein
MKETFSLKNMAEHFELIHGDLKPEAKLLLGCARTSMDVSTTQQISLLLRGNIDWKELLEMAQSHNLVPLLYRNLEAICPGRIPELVRAKMQQQIQVNIQGNLYLTRELLHLLAAFEQHDIPVLPYKGPVLSASVYGDLGLRPSNDLDILVREKDVLRGTELLIALGFEIIRPSSVARKEKQLQSARLDQLVRSSPWAYQVVLWHPEKKIIVELHWRITPKYIFSKSPAQLWEGLTAIRLGGGTAFSFSPENLLWFLCVHGTKHQWQRLIWICDVAELIRAQPKLNWEQVLARASGLGMERRLFLGLLLAHGLLEAPLPRAIETRFQTASHVKILARQVIEEIFEDMQDSSPRFPGLDRFTFQLKAMDRTIDRGRYLLRFATGSRH